MARYEIKTPTSDNFYTYTSPSQVLGLLDKGGLKQWAVNKAIDYIDNNLSSLLSAHKDEYISIMNDARFAHKDYTKETADYGSMFHNIVEKWIKSVINGNIKHKECIESVLDYAKHFDNQLKQMFYQFWLWQRKHVVRFIESEFIIIDEVRGYAGQCDIICQIGTKNYCIDLKTSKDFYSGYGKQVAAYAQAIEVMATGEYTIIKRQDGAEWRVKQNYNKRIEIDGIGVLRVSRDFFDTKLFKTYNKENRISSWNNLLTYYYGDAKRKLNNLRMVK